jgi:hypothetical protein
MMNKIEKTEVEGLFKTNEGTFLFANDRSTVNAYKKRRMELEAKDNEINRMKDQINNMKDDISSIKEMLQLLLQKG